MPDSPATSAAAPRASPIRPELSILRIVALVLFTLALVLAVVAEAQDATFYLRLATEALIFGGLALSVDLLLGRTGMLTLGQALYFGIGAYTSALVLRDVAPSFMLAVGAGVLASILAGVLGGWIAVRARGVYFALITFGLAQVVSRVVYNTRELGASDGMIGIPVVDINLGLVTIGAADPFGFFLFVLTLMIAAWAFLSYALDTPHGRVLAAVRANEGRLAFLGYNVRNYKLGVYVAAAALAGFSGALYPMLRGFVSPELMYFQTSAWAIIAVIIGGMGTLIGALAGTMLLTFMRSVLSSYTEHHHIVVGVLFVIVVIAFPKGLLGMVVTRLSRWRNQREDAG